MILCLLCLCPSLGLENMILGSKIYMSYVSVSESRTQKNRFSQIQVRDSDTKKSILSNPSPSLGHEEPCVLSPSPESGLESQIRLGIRRNFKSRCMQTTYWS